MKASQHSLPDAEVVELPATAFGWLRRPELDGGGIQVWELPNGMLHPARAGDGVPRLVTFFPPPLRG